MKNHKSDIIIIRGAPGTGKSETAKSLSKYFPTGVRMEIDALRSMVISVDWTNQEEHTNMISVSSGLVKDFITLGFKPVIVIDTFSNGKITKYLQELLQLDGNLSIKIFGLYVSENELKRRIGARKQGEFKKLNICQTLNEQVKALKYDGEFQIDTTGLIANETAHLIYKHLNKQE